MATPDTCRTCGPDWPAITDSLCLLCLQRAHDRTRQLLDVIDTPADLTDIVARAEWVKQVQRAADDTAAYLPLPARTTTPVEAAA